MGYNKNAVVLVVRRKAYNGVEGLFLGGNVLIVSHANLDPCNRNCDNGCFFIMGLLTCHRTVGRLK